MALNIKKSFILNSGNISNNESFKLLLSKLDSSWIDKEKSLQEGQETIDKFENNNLINFLPDSHKNKSLITYIDAPWGSGKTYFIEQFIDYIENESKISIDVIDAWEIYTGSNINNVLGSIFSNSINEEKLIKKYKENIKDWDPNRKSKIIMNVMRNVEIVSQLSKFVIPIISQAIESGAKITKESNQNKVLKYEEVMKNIGRDERIIITKSIIELIEEENLNNKKYIVIDNIERLSSKNRLDVINKVMNWANISGITFIFLTNFEKIQFATALEEDFWNKISLHETFKLENSWNDYINDYKYKEFEMAKHPKLSTFISEVIPLFFSSNSDNMDIREIKKLLDNWLSEIEKDLNSIDYIKLFLKLAEENLKGLDKYFLLNNSITLLSENYWDLFEDAFEDKIGQLDEEEDESFNLPLFNNKMLRIQSNFFDLELEFDENKNIKLKEGKFTLSNEDKKEFKSFNNFIDETSANKFIKLIDDISKTRVISNEKNYLKTIMNKDPEMNKYFEFKNNNIKKIFIYNEMKT